MHWPDDLQDGSKPGHGGAASWPVFSEGVAMAFHVRAAALAGGPRSPSRPSTVILYTVQRSCDAIWIGVVRYPMDMAIDAF